jgi:hypothetical protein
MPWIQSLAGRLTTIDCRSIAELDEEIVDELQFHIEMRTLDGLRTGLTLAAAREAALAKFGNFEQIHRDCRRTLLGERIMLQRIQAVLTIVLLLTVVAIGYQMYSAQHTNEQALADMQAALRQLAAAAPGSGWHTDRPRVVETFPAGGATDVDPGTSEIRVTFNKTMTDGCWSWVQSSAEAFPEAAGEVHYLDDMKTCVMPVKLEPGKKYVVWFNTAEYQNFKDVDGRPAEPRLLTFSTRE